MEKKNNNASSKLPQEVLTVDEAQSKITLLMQEAYLQGYSREKIEKELVKIIKKAQNSVDILRLKEDIRQSLYMHANRIYNMLKEQIDLSKLKVIITTKNNKYFAYSKFKLDIDNDDILSAKKDIGYETTKEGMPLHYWHGNEYFKKRVFPIMEKLAGMQALDPNDERGKNSLRNLAEMEARYINHEQNIKEKKESGIKLVMATQHVDCSPRCAPWQGRVYSLDGTSGITDDGRKYVPLEEATDVYYTTKKGRTYKNGLLGFNCRHRLIDYHSGLAPPKIDEKEREKEYAINQKQRYLERLTRKQKLKAELIKNIDNDEYIEEKQKAIAYARQYKEFCKNNSRAFYSERLNLYKIK